MLKLLKDNNKWVKLSAYLQLGNSLNYIYHRKIHIFTKRPPSPRKTPKTISKNDLTLNNRIR